MKIEFPKIFSSPSTQPTTAIIAPNNVSRVECNITALADGPFYIKRGATASATNFDFMLVGTGSSCLISNYCGDIYCFPIPTAGQINVADGSSLFV